MILPDRLPTPTITPYKQTRTQQVHGAWDGGAQNNGVTLARLAAHSAEYATFQRRNYGGLVTMGLVTIPDGEVHPQPSGP